MLFLFVILFFVRPVVYAVPVGIEGESSEYNDLLNSKELSKYSRDLFGSVISAVRKGDRQKARLLIRRVLTAYPEHPVAWEFDGTLKFLDRDYKGAERSLIKSLTYMPERATARAKMGLVRLAQNNYADARKLFKETLSQDPDNWIANRYLAKMADAEGNTLQAIEHYSKLVNSKSVEVTAIHIAYARDLARLKRYQEMVELLEPLSKTRSNPELTLLLAEAYMSLGKAEAARIQLEQAKTITPDDTRIQLLTAIDLRLSGETKQSVKIFEELIANNDDNALFYYHYGLALQKLNKPEKAKQAFLDAVEHSPATSSLRVMLAAEFEALKLPENVIKALEPLAKSKSKKDVIYRLVQAYSNIGNWKKGLKHTDKMIEKYPEFVPARLLRIEILRGMNRIEQAEDYAKQTLSLFPTSIEVLKSYTRILFQNNKKKQALEKLKQVAVKQPENKIVTFMLANQYQAANFPAQAETIYRKLLEESPGNSGLLNNLAVVLSQQSGKLDEALKLSKQAHKQAPKNAAIADSLGWILHLSEQPKQAENLLNQALSLQPAMKEAQCHLGLVKFKRGKPHSELLDVCMEPGMDDNLQLLAQQALAE